MPRFVIRVLVGTCLALIACVGHAAHCEPFVPDVATTADEIAAAGAWTRFSEAASASSDLRLRVAIPRFGLVRCEDGLVFDAPDHELGTLVELARGSTDPMVLGTLADRCRAVDPGGRRRCNALNFADRWTIADSQNAAAWLTQAAIRRDRGDVDGSMASVARAAKASIWRSVNGERMHVILQALPASMAPRDQIEVLVKANGYVEGRVWSFASILRDVCTDPSSRPACDAILATLFNDASSLLELRIAAIYTVRSRADDTTVASRFRRADAMSEITQLTQERLFASLDDPVQVAQALASLRARFTLGEVRSMQDALARMGMTEESAARRYLQAFTPQQLALQMSMRRAPHP